MHCASKVHFQATKRVIKYVKCAANFGIMFKKTLDFQFLGFSHSEWAGNSYDVRSTSGYNFGFGSGIFSWCSKKQDIVAQSRAEVEYIVVASTMNQALLIQKLLDLYMVQKKSTESSVDDQATISIANNHVSHGNTKYFKIKFYFLREMQKNGDIHLEHCENDFQNADILTKAQPSARYEFLRKKLGIAAPESRRIVESSASKLKLEISSTYYYINIQHKSRCSNK
ncbi:hypothetical protein MTR67_051219 [Solanum verrucosum]|uniref:Uncharacterized protein n=1 Tax=Solanum verrucosum TaxID=315347 RepID=A0AAF0V5U1_SOLVR|nr:hypothetical protein MTR67_051219 [Solanum verrucosum]